LVLVKLDFLEAIDVCGSISSAARQMKISYKRAWDLVDVINKSFKQRSVTTSPGGKNGGGAKLTKFGRFILNNYRNLVVKTYSATDAELTNIISNLTLSE